MNVYGVTLGSNIDEALAYLGSVGYPVTRMPFVEKGRVYYPIQGFFAAAAAALPFSLTDRAVSGQFYVTAYNGAVLSVVIRLDYDRSRSFEDLKSAVWNAFPYLTGQGDLRGVHVADGIFRYEIGTALTNTYGIWMHVTDKTHGTCRLELEHVDLTHFSYYWMAGGQ